MHDNFDVLRARSDAAAAIVVLHLKRISLILRGFNPDQPRDDHGRWTDGGSSSFTPTNSGNRVVAVAPVQSIGNGTTGWPFVNELKPQTTQLFRDEGDFKPQLVQLEGDAQYKVNMEEEEARGGHALRDHIGKSYNVLMSQSGAMDATIKNTIRINEGTFGSDQEAEDYTNMALRANKNIVDRVVNEKDIKYTAVNERFGAVTGKELFVYTDGISINAEMRPTYSVRVIITYAPNSPRGYRVHTAFPTNLNKDD